MADTTTTETVAKPAVPAKKSRKLMIIILAIVLAGAGGGAWYFFSHSKASAATTKKEKAKKAHADEAEQDGEEASDGEQTKKKAVADSTEFSLPDDSKVKEVVELQPYVINLADKGQARYLRLTVSVGISGTDSKEKPSALFTTRIRNAMLALLTSKTSDEVLTIEGKTKLRKELLRAARAASEDPKVEAIYITEFIVQL